MQCDSDYAILAEAKAIEFPAIRLNLLDGPKVEGIARPSGKPVSLRHALPIDQVHSPPARGLYPAVGMVPSLGLQG